MAACIHPSLGFCLCCLPLFCWFLGKFGVAPQPLAAHPLRLGGGGARGGVYSAAPDYTAPPSLDALSGLEGKVWMLLLLLLLLLEAAILLIFTWEKASVKQLSPTPE